MDGLFKEISSFKKGEQLIVDSKIAVYRIHFDIHSRRILYYACMLILAKRLRGVLKISPQEYTFWKLKKKPKTVIFNAFVYIGHIEAITIH